MTLFWHRVGSVVGACCATTFCFGIVAAAAVMVETVGQLTRIDGGGAVALFLWALAVLECAYQALAVSVPVACAFVAVTWARRGEALAVAQLGLSPLYAEGPLWMGAFLVCCGAAALAHEGVPRVVALRNHVMRAHLQQGDNLSRAYVEPPTWFFLPEQLLFVPSQPASPRAQLPCAQDGVCFADPILYGWRRGRIDSVTQAKALGTDGNVLSLYQTTTHFIDSPAQQSRPRLPLPDAFLPSELSHLLGNPRELPSHDLSLLIERREAARLPAQLHRWELAARTSGPLSAWASVVVVTPFLLSFDRRRTLAHNVLHAAWVAGGALFGLQMARAMAMARELSFVAATFAPLLGAGTFRLGLWLRRAALSFRST